MGTYLKFEDLVDFVCEIADEMNESLCGMAAKADRSHSKKQVTSHGTQSSSKSGGNKSQHIYIVGTSRPDLMLAQMVICCLAPESQVVMLHLAMLVHSAALHV